MTTQIVLIPLDGSPFSRSILTEVCRLLDPQQYHVLLLRVAEPQKGLVGKPPRLLPVGDALLPLYDSVRDVELMQHPIYVNQITDSRRAELAAALQTDAHQLRDAGFNVTTDVRFGDPAEEIIAAAEEHDVDLVALATHGRSGLPRLVLGSVAEHVLHRLPVPVLMLRPFGRAAQRESQEELDHAYATI